MKRYNLFGGLTRCQKFGSTNAVNNVKRHGCSEFGARKHERIRLTESFETYEAEVSQIQIGVKGLRELISCKIIIQIPIGTI